MASTVKLFEMKLYLWMWLVSFFSHFPQESPKDTQTQFFFKHIDGELTKGIQAILLWHSE